MANCFLNGREMRPEPLRPKVQFGSALIIWLCVDKEPPLVSFERQSSLSAECQRNSPCPLGLGRPTDKTTTPPYRKATLASRIHLRPQG